MTKESAQLIQSTQKSDLFSVIFLGSKRDVYFGRKLLPLLSLITCEDKNGQCIFYLLNSSVVRMVKAGTLPPLWLRSPSRP